VSLPFSLITRICSWLIYPPASSARSPGSPRVLLQYLEHALVHAPLLFLTVIYFLGGVASIAATIPSTGKIMEMTRISRYPPNKS